jgi:cysteine desulfuration protein SufE
MTLHERHQQLVHDLSVIPDRQERLTILVERARHAPALAAAAKTPANRVPGCVSAIWVHSEIEGGRMRLQFAAEAPVVRGLVGLMCELYSGATPDEIATAEPTLFDELELTRDLSPTRKHGLAAVRARIRDLARSALTRPPEPAV